MCIDNREVSWKMYLEIGVEASRMNGYEGDLVFVAVLLHELEVFRIDGKGVYNERVLLFVVE
jgi:hypothetical protein